MVEVLMDEVKKILLAQLMLKKEMDKNGIKICLIADDYCSANIIGAHSIQNKNVLDVLSDSSGHVYTFSLDTSKKIEKIGVNKASVFNGFCGDHDNKIFEYIDNQIYSSLDPLKADFLYAFRALAKELYTKMNVVAKHDYFYDQYDQNNTAPLKKKFQHLNDSDLRNLFGKGSMVREGIEFQRMAVKELKTSFDRFLHYYRAEDFFRVRTISMRFSGNNIAASTCFAPEFNTKGHKVNDIEDLKKPLRSIYVSLLPDGDSTYVLISYLKNEEGYLNTFLKDLKGLSGQEQLHYLERLLFAHCENMVFSKDYINSLDDQELDYIYDLFRGTTTSLDLVSTYTSPMDIDPKLFSLIS